MQCYEKENHPINKIHLSQYTTKKLTENYASEYESANLKLLPTTFIKLQILNFFIVFFLQFLNSKLGSFNKCMAT